MTTLNASGYNLKEVNEILLNGLNKVTECFYENYMVLNAGQCHFACLGKDTENETFISKGIIMNNSKEDKIVRATIQYTSENYVNNHTID